MVKKTIRLLLVFSIPVMVMLLSNCKKDKFGNGTLTFSTDTLTFDTVFTSIGSTTEYFKVFNTDKKAVKISDIRLMHLTGTQFRMNVDGVSGDHFTNVEIPAKDSIYVFVEVTVNPNSAATPFVIIDDVSFLQNGAAKTVHLQAWGQNAHFHYGEAITSNKTWSNDLPHVIISHDTVPGVEVRCGATLTINPGCKIYFAANSAIFVEGTLNAKATTWNDSILFQGVRLEQFYHDKPGQWFGIVFLRDSTGNPSCTPHGNFSHCVLNESSYGIYAGAGLSTNLSTYQGSTGRPVITIDNTIVKNSQNNAVFGFNADITANNSLFYVAGDNLLKFGLGGKYTFNQCTMFNNGSRYIDHQKEVLLLSNFVATGSTVYAEHLQTSFINCVIYGSLQNEISFNNYKNPPTDFTDFDNAFHYSDVKTKVDTFNMFTTVQDNTLFNQDPLFRNQDAGDFTPSDTNGTVSPLIDYCPNGSLIYDLYDRFRTKVPNLNRQGIYDAGAVEAP